MNKDLYVNCQCISHKVQFRLSFHANVSLCPVHILLCTRPQTQAQRADPFISAQFILSSLFRLRCSSSSSLISSSPIPPIPQIPPSPPRTPRNPPKSPSPSPSPSPPLPSPPPANMFLTNLPFYVIKVSHKARRLFAKKNSDDDSSRSYYYTADLYGPSRVGQS